MSQSVIYDLFAERGDLFFWKGHVAMAVDDQTLIHLGLEGMMLMGALTAFWAAQASGSMNVL